MSNPHAAVYEFLRDREVALRSLDRVQIVSYMTKYGIAVPASDETFWAGVHKARHALSCFSDAERLASQKWLSDHGYRLLR